MVGRRTRLSDYGFFVVLLACGWLLWRTLAPVLIPVVLGAFVAVLVRPWFSWTLRHVGGRRRIAAFATTMMVICVVLIPLVVLGWALVGQLVPAASNVTNAVQKEGLVRALQRLPALQHLQLSDQSVQRVADEALAWSASHAEAIALGVPGLFVDAFLLLLALFYFLVDGYRWLEEVARLAPIEPRYVHAFFVEFDRVSHGLFFGNIVTALIQGVFGTLGYALFGVPQAIFWGAATALVSLVPAVGTAIVWAPMAVLIALSGSVGRGVGIALWGIFVIGLVVDNLIRPQLLKGRMRLHPLMVFLSLIGGAFAFGAVGLFIGPMAASLFFAAVRIYDRDYRSQLDASSLPIGP